MKTLRALRLACGGCARCLGTFALWTLWLALALLAAAQLRVACTDQLEVPGFVLRSLEDRLAASGIRVAFGRTLFDPSGRVLIEKASLTLPSFQEPFATAGAIYLRVNPWELILRRFDPIELRATGVSLNVPAPLSLSGRSESVVRDLDFSVFPRGNDISIAYLTGRFGPMPISIHGSMHLPSAAGGKTGPMPGMDFLARHYGGFSRSLDAALLKLRGLDQPVLQAELVPSESHGAVARLDFFARGLKLPGAERIEADDLNVSARLPLLAPEGEPAAAVAEASALRLPRGIELSRVWARASGSFVAGKPFPVPEKLDIAAASAGVGPLAFAAPLAQVEAEPWPKLRLSAQAQLLGEPLALQAEGDLAARAATARFRASLAPGLIDLVGARIGRNLRRYASWTVPPRTEGEARFGPGWKFAGASARLEARDVTAWHVVLREARGRISFDGHRLSAPEAFVRTGHSFARGSYDQDVASKSYRFLLDGSLQPLDIAPWFPAWWRTFWGDFQFSGGPPAASVDVQGRWGTGRDTSVFVFADCPKPRVRGAALDRVLTRIFVRPQFEDGLEVLATSGVGVATGTFSRRYDFDRGALRSLDVAVDSTVDPRLAATILGPEDSAALTPFAFTRPPVIHVLGHFDGPAAPNGPSSALHVQAKADAPLRFYGFPLDSVAFTADTRGEDIVVQPIAAGLAGGALSGTARLHRRNGARILNFSASLRNASLGQAIVAVATYAAPPSSKIPSSVGAFAQGRDRVRLDLDVSAEGPCGDPYELRGSGQAKLEGAGLGEIPLFGGLSRVLKFTSLRFTDADTQFTIAGRQLIFPRIAISGANSAVEASGIYALDQRSLDFTARVFPFQHSETLPKVLLNIVTVPFSSVLQVKLSGRLDAPSWSPVLSLRGPSAPPAGKAGAPVGS